MITPPLLLCLGLGFAPARANVPLLSLRTVTHEASEHGVTAEFEIVRTGPTTTPLSVRYAAEGTAANGADYARLLGEITIPAGQSNVLLTVAPVDDALVESNETLRLTLRDDLAPFSLIILPDTQWYIGSGNAPVFAQQVRWIQENKDALNVAFVLQEGDCTDWNSFWEWSIFSSVITNLDGVVPYAIAAGNHDGLGTAMEDTALFNQFFPQARYQSLPWFGATFETNRMENCYHLFSAGGVDWLLLVLEFGPRDIVLNWANNVVASHPDRRVLINTHAHVYSDDTLHGTYASQFWRPRTYGRANDGTDVWEKLVRRHANMACVFNGHVLNDGAGRVVGIGDHGNRVFQMLANYQFYPLGGSGFLRIVRFLPAEDKITVQSYSPYLDFYLTDPKQQFEFVETGLFPAPLPAYAVNPLAASAEVMLLDNDADTRPPAITAVKALGVPPRLAVTFDEPVSRASAENLASYSVPGVIFHNAALATNRMTVILRTDSFLTTGVEYVLTTRQIQDRAAPPNTLLLSKKTFTYEPVLLAEDFSAREPGGWSIIDQGTRDTPSHWKIRSGRFEQTGRIFGPDVYALDHRRGTVAYWDDPTARLWADYTFNATLNAVDDDGVGVVFRFLDESNYYKLDLDLQRNFQSLFRVVEGEESLLASQPGGFPIYRDFRVGVRLAGAEMVVSLDGTNLFGGPIHDELIPSGTVGLYSWGCEGVSFDDITVEAGAVPFRHGTNVTPVVSVPPTLITLVPFDRAWMFWSFEDPVDSGWAELAFDDSAWPGPNSAIFGQDPDPLPDPVNTSLSLGPMSYYFRTPFTWDTNLVGACLRLYLLLDDGAACYINGQEVLRVGMPPGVIAADTPAGREIDNARYEGPFDLELTNLVHGTNMLAVELHQSWEFSEDVVFAAELEAAIPHPVPVPFGPVSVIGDGRVHLTLPGPVGRVTWVEASPDLRQWQRMASFTNYYGLPISFTADPTASPQRFYRAFAPPASCSER